MSASSVLVSDIELKINNAVWQLLPIHLTAMISLSRERGLLWLRHRETRAFSIMGPALQPLDQLPPSTRSTLLTVLVSQVPLFVLSILFSILSGSLAKEALLIGVHCKKHYINVWIQYNTIDGIVCILFSTTISNYNTTLLSTCYLYILCSICIFVGMLTTTVQCSSSLLK